MSTRVLYEYDDLGVYTGRFRTIDKWHGVPPGWTEKTVPVTPEGMFAVFQEGAWSVKETLPLPPVPSVVSRAQGRTALHRFGVLATVEALVYAAEADPETRIAYEAGEWHRNSPMLLTLAAGLGLTEEQVDDLFRMASEILL